MNPEEVARIRAMLREQTASAPNGREGLFSRLRPSALVEGSKKPDVAGEDHRRSASEPLPPRPLEAAGRSAMAGPPKEMERPSEILRLGGTPVAPPAPAAEPDVLELSGREIIAPSQNGSIAKAPTTPETPKFGRREEEETGLRRTAPRVGVDDPPVGARQAAQALAVAKADIPQASSPIVAGETALPLDAPLPVRQPHLVPQNGAHPDEAVAVANTDPGARFSDRPSQSAPQVASVGAIASEPTPARTSGSEVDADEEPPRAETVTVAKAPSGATLSILQFLTQQTTADEPASLAEAPSSSVQPSSHAHDDVSTDEAAAITTADTDTGADGQAEPDVATPPFVLTPRVAAEIAAPAPAFASESKRDAHEDPLSAETAVAPKLPSGATFSILPFLMRKMIAAEVAGSPEAHTSCALESDPPEAGGVSEVQMEPVRDALAVVSTSLSPPRASMAAEDVTPLPASASPSVDAECVVGDALADSREVAVGTASSFDVEAAEPVGAVGVLATRPSAPAEGTLSLELSPRRTADRSEVASAPTPRETPDRMSRVAAVIELRDFAQGQRRPYLPSADAAALMRDLHDVLLAERSIVDMWLTVARTGS